MKLMNRSLNIPIPIVLPSVLPYLHWLNIGWFISPWTHCKRMGMFCLLFCAVCNPFFGLCRDPRCVFFSLDCLDMC